jgi:hypothetical protein
VAITKEATTKNVNLKDQFEKHSNQTEIWVLMQYCYLQLRKRNKRISATRDKQLFYNNCNIIQKVQNA